MHRIHPRVLFASIVFFLLSLPTENLLAQFTDVAVSVGIDVTHDGASVADMGMGNGAAWFDYDNDGDLDLYYTMRTGANMLFRNDGGSFTDVAASAGVADASHDGSGVAVADYNNDGCKDLYLANSDEDVFFENDCDGTFTDITAGSGLEASGERRGTSASWGDYDEDGFVDLYVSHHNPVDGSSVPDDKTKAQDYLFHNNGDGTFTDVSDDLLGDDREKASFIGSWTDYDNDGDLDIYLIKDCPFDAAGPMRLWRNDGGTNGVTDWTFTEVSGSVNAEWCQNGMGIAVGDYDRNGFMDYYYTDNGSTPGSVHPERAGTILLKNNGGSFSDETDAAGVASTNFSWGANFFDYDLDGWQDLYMAGGSLNNFDPIESQLWNNDGNGSTFTNVSVAQGMADPGRSKTSVIADYDQDGDPDLFLVNYAGAAKLYRNDNGGGNNWLIVDLIGTDSNRDGIGARLELTSAGGTQYFEIHSGSSLGGGDDVAAYFGLGSDGTVTSLEITWPSGTVQTLTNVGVNQRLSVTEDDGGNPGSDLFTDVAVASGINVTHTEAAGDMGIGTGAAWFDYDNDGDQDLYMTMRTGSNKLFRNDNGSFTDVASSAGVADASGDGSGVAVADYNNDGCRDIYLANSFDDRLYENNCDGTFTDVMAGSGLESSEERRGTSASWGDYDQDGFLDLYVAHHMPVDGSVNNGDAEQDYVYHNDGDGTFTDVSDLLLGTERMGRSFIAGWFDYDNDGDPDILTIRDCPFGQNSGPMRLYRNDGGTNGASDWTFTQVAETANADWCQNGMGLATGDYDRDGDLDVFFTDNGNSTTEYPGSPNRKGTVLLKNTGSAFVDATDEANVSSSNFSWGANFFDYDLDGWQDLYMVGGALNATDVQVEGQLWNNNGNGIDFTNVSSTSGVNDDARSRTSVYSDYDEDGDPDLFLVNYLGQARLFQNNNSNGNNWVIVDLEGTTSNRDGIGARLELSTPDGVTQHFETRSGSSLGGGDDLGAYFGIGSNGSISSLQITWPSGTVQTVSSLGINQRHLIVEEGGTGGSTLTASPSSIDFGQQTIGTTSSPETVTLTNNGSESIDVTSVTISGSDAADFNHTFSGTETIPGGGTSTFDVTFSPNAQAAPLASEVLYRVNAGGEGVDDWETDTDASPSAYLLAGSATIESDTPTPTLDSSVPDGTPLDLFYDKRRDADKADPAMEWDFSVTAGEELEIRLYFAEFSRCEDGNRLFDVEIEGTIVLDDFDVYNEAGSACNVGIMRSFIVTPGDGNLDIDFPLVNGRPSIISGFEIISTDGTAADMRTADLTVIHTGTNGNQVVDLSGEALPDGGGNIDPTADFTFAANALTVDFTDASTDSDGSIVAWSWDFGDGNTSTSQNPSHTYAAGGTYTVMLTVTDNGGAIDDVNKDVVVSTGNAAPTASFTYSVNDLTVDFTDTSTDSDGSIVSWDWDFGDGNTSTAQNPSHAYAGYGVYTVSLTVTDDAGATGNTSQSVNVPDPNADGAFIESDGIVVFETENYTSRVERGDHMWIESTDNAGFSGTTAMQSDPDDGGRIWNNPENTSPELIFDIDFSTTGTYYVWHRLWGVNKQGNKTYAGLNGDASDRPLMTNSFGEWIWVNVRSGGELETVEVTSAGVQTAHVWMADDGVYIDKMVMTTDPDFVPTGIGPDESPRGGSSPTAAKHAAAFSDNLVLESVQEVPAEFSLQSNYPNPFNPSTTIKFGLPEDANVRLEVFDAMGRKVATLVDGQLTAGYHEAQWDAITDAGATVASGIYLYRIQTGAFTFSRTMMLLK